MPSLSAIIPYHNFSLNWNRLFELFPVLKEMNGSTQDPIFHAEGDALVHTKMVCDEMMKLSTFRDLPLDDQFVLITSAIFHDCAKPMTWTIDEETKRITNPSHSRKGAKLAWDTLWKVGVPLNELRRVYWLVHRHMMPLHFMENPIRSLISTSQELPLRQLAILSEADMRGRVCVDKEEQKFLIDSIPYMIEFAENELMCADTPYPFVTNYARWDYLTERERPSPQMWQATAPKDFIPAIVLCGLPGSGKSLMSEIFQNHTVVSIDAWREKMGVKPDENSGPVVQAALGEVKQLLAKRKYVCWESTNLTKDLRGGVLQLFRAYKTIPEIQYLHIDYSTMFERNKERDKDGLPLSVLNRMASRFELPSYVEAATVNFIDNNN